VENSRYLDRKRLKAILAALGYAVLKEKTSSKLVYYYCVYRGTPESEEEEGAERAVFGKTELRKGGGKNNFAIVLR